MSPSQTNQKAAAIVKLTTAHANAFPYKGKLSFSMNPITLAIASVSADRSFRCRHPALYGYAP